MAPTRPAATPEPPAQGASLPGRAGTRVSVSRQALAVLRKDLRAELRSRAAISAILLFSVTALVVIAFASHGDVGGPVGQAALLWVLLFFSTFSGLSHVFLHEEESGTALVLQAAADPLAVFYGKLLFNGLLLSAIALIVVPVYCEMLGLEVGLPVAFVAVLVSGLVCLATAATIVAAMIARARGKGALFGALGFPILLPMLMIACKSTEEAIAGEGLTRALVGALGLACYAVLLLLAGGLLFPVVWED